MFLIITVIITERFNIHFNRITWLLAAWSFLFVCMHKFINAPLLYYWNWSKVSQLLPSSIILELFCKCLTTREWQKLTLAWFNLKNILPSLALETGTVNNNLIIYSTSLQTLLLGTIKILLHVTKYKNQKLPTYGKKLNYFTFSVFFLFVCRWWQCKNEWFL